MAGASYTIVVVFSAIGLVFLIACLVISRVLRPNRPTREKLTTYECGIEPVGQSQSQFRVHYYIFALVFVLFDVETVYLFPWALKLGQLRMFAFLEMLVFLAILAVGLIYAWRTGMLEWAE